MKAFAITVSVFVVVVLLLLFVLLRGLPGRGTAEVAGIDYDQHAETAYELTSSSRGGFSS